MSDANSAVEGASSAAAESIQEPTQPTTIDRLDRRFRIKGNVAEALKVVVAERSDQIS